MTRRPAHSASHPWRRTVLLDTATVLAAFCSALYLAWLSLSTVDFAYPLLYRLLDIDRTIAVYAPQNRYKEGFPVDDRAEHARLFARIVDAVNDGGAGLREIRYRASGKPVGRLLRPPEVQHLQDVADLLTVLERVALAALAVLAVLLYRRRRGGYGPLGVGRALLYVLAVTGLGAAATLAAGPTRLFYALHTLAFPAGHQWFFYYQESYMTTLMQAPNLFGAIALLVLVATLGWFALIVAVADAWLESGERGRRNRGAKTAAR